MSGYTRINAGAVAFAASEGMNPEFVAATYSDATHPVFKVIIRFAQSQFELRRYGDWAERAIAAHALFEKDEFARDEVLTNVFQWDDAVVYSEKPKEEVE